MPQLHLYLPDDVAERLKAKARARRLPLSRYLAEVVARDVSPDWPPGFFEDVLGAWQGAPLERAAQGTLETPASW